VPEVQALVGIGLIFVKWFICASRITLRRLNLNDRRTHIGYELAAPRAEFASYFQNSNAL
jgi:hypothetical protein